jgi:cell division protein FtsL
VALAFKIDPEFDEGFSSHPRITQLPKVSRRNSQVSPFIADAESDGDGAAVTMAEVRVLPRQPKFPVWLKVLMGIQQGSTVITGGLVATTLVVYSWTVYVDNMVYRTFQQLEQSKTQTQQMTTANETLKHNMALQAESTTSGLTAHQPQNTLFVKPSPSRTLPATQPTTNPTPNPMPLPLGY